MAKQGNHHNLHSPPPSWVRGKSIGQGSFGIVSLAVGRADGGIFAVKSVHLNGCDPTRIDSLENEIRILRSLSSPYVVEYLGDDVTVESPGTSYRNLHLEYLRGGTAADLAGCHGADVDETLVRYYTKCVVSALQYLHSKGIVHCDVKGRNVLLGSTSAKLADFGSAKVLSGHDLPPRGSPLWMAPEVIRGEFQGPKSDVWSLGCTVLEMITGKPAWEDEGADTVRRIAFSKELPAVPVKFSELGRDFVKKCLRRDPSERWSCDRLLQHPFLSCVPTNITVETSPRCVLDWVNVQFEDESEETEQNPTSNKNGASATGRIGELASSRLANWESGGWEEVRSSESCEGATAESCHGDERVGASTEFQESADVKREESVRAILEYLNSGGSVCCCEDSKREVGDPGCDNYGLKRQDPGYIYSLCKTIRLYGCYYHFSSLKRNLLSFLLIYYILRLLSLASSFASVKKFC